MKKNDLFGSALAFSPGSNKLAIGAMSDGRSSPGYVSVYSFLGKLWEKVFNLNGETNGDRFSVSVAMPMSVKSR